MKKNICEEMQKCECSRKMKCWFNLFHRRSRIGLATREFGTRRTLVSSRRKRTCTPLKQPWTLPMCQHRPARQTLQQHPTQVQYTPAPPTSLAEITQPYKQSEQQTIWHKPHSWFDSNHTPVYMRFIRHYSSIAFCCAFAHELSRLLSTLVCPRSALIWKWLFLWYVRNVVLGKL